MCRTRSFCIIDISFCYSGAYPIKTCFSGGSNIPTSPTCRPSLTFVIEIDVLEIVIRYKRNLVVKIRSGSSNRFVRIVAPILIDCRCTNMRNLCLLNRNMDSLCSCFIVAACFSTVDNFICSYAYDLICCNFGVTLLNDERDFSATQSCNCGKGVRIAIISHIAICCSNKYSFRLRDFKHTFLRKDRAVFVGGSKNNYILAHIDGTSIGDLFALLIVFHPIIVLDGYAIICAIFSGGSKRRNSGTCVWIKGPSCATTYNCERVRAGNDLIGDRSCCFLVGSIVPCIILSSFFSKRKCYSIIVTYVLTTLRSIRAVINFGNGKASIIQSGSLIAAIVSLICNARYDNILLDGERNSFTLGCFEIVSATANKLCSYIVCTCVGSVGRLRNRSLALLISVVLEDNLSVVAVCECFVECNRIRYSCGIAIRPTRIVYFGLGNGYCRLLDDYRNLYFLRKIVVGTFNGVSKCVRSRIGKGRALILQRSIDNCAIFFNLEINVCTVTCNRNRNVNRVTIKRLIGKVTRVNGNFCFLDSKRELTTDYLIGIFVVGIVKYSCAYSIVTCVSGGITATTQSKRRNRCISIPTNPIFRVGCIGPYFAVFGVQIFEINFACVYRMVISISLFEGNSGHFYIVTIKGYFVHNNIVFITNSKVVVELDCSLGNDNGDRLLLCSFVILITIVVVGNRIFTYIFDFNFFRQFAIDQNNNLGAIACFSVRISDRNTIINLGNIASVYGNCNGFLCNGNSDIFDCARRIVACCIRGKDCNKLVLGCTVEGGVIINNDSGSCNLEFPSSLNIFRKLDLLKHLISVDCGENSDCLGVRFGGNCILQSESIGLCCLPLIVGGIKSNRYIVVTNVVRILCIIGLHRIRNRITLIVLIVSRNPIRRNNAISGVSEFYLRKRWRIDLLSIYIDSNFYIICSVVVLVALTGSKDCCELLILSCISKFGFLDTPLTVFAIGKINVKNTVTKGKRLLLVTLGHLYFVRCDGYNCNFGCSLVMFTFGERDSNGITPHIYQKIENFTILSLIFKDEFLLVVGWCNLIKFKFSSIVYEGITIGIDTIDGGVSSFDIYGNVIGYNIIILDIFRGIGNCKRFRANTAN